MLSIIIPTLNEERAIEQTLKNLRSIHSLLYEIIIADTKSTDRTRDIAEKYADTVVVYQGTKKPNAAIIRNLGATVAKGDVLLFQDADVILKDADAFVVRVRDVLQKNPEFVALTVSTRVDSATATLMDGFMSWAINMSFIILNNVLHVGGASGECQIVRREAFDKVGGYDESLPVSEDADLFQKLARVGRTRMLTDLLTVQSGRRQHAIGWPRLLLQWWGNWISVTFFHTSVTSHWEEIR